MCPLKWKNQYHLLEKHYHNGVKPPLLVPEHIMIVHPMDEKHMAVKPGKNQVSDEPSKKFNLGVQIPRKPKHGNANHVCVDKNCKLYKKHEACTPCTTPWSVIGTRKRALLHGVCLHSPCKTPMRTRQERSPCTGHGLRGKLEISL